MAQGSPAQQGQLPAAAAFFNAVQGALADSLKTLCQDQAAVGELSVMDAAPAVAGTHVAGMCAGVRDQEGWTLRLVAPLPEALTLTGLSLYMDSDEIATMRGRETASEDDLDGLKSLTDQLFSGVGTAIRAAFGGEFAFEAVTVECKAVTEEEAADWFPTEGFVAEVPLSITSYEDSQMFLAVTEATVQELAGRIEANNPAEAAPEPTATEPAEDTAALATGVEIPADESLQRILKVSVPVIVLLAETQATMDEVLKMTEGSVVQFSKSDEALLDLMVNNKKIGSGKVVKVGKKFGLRIEQIGDTKEIIQKL